jgi:hypothetical protein
MSKLPRAQWAAGVLCVAFAAASCGHGSSHDKGTGSGTGTGSGSDSGIGAEMDSGMPPPSSGPVVSGFVDVGGPYPWPTWTKYVPTVPPSTTGNTYYVDGTNGSDSNAGTSADKAFKTIHAAIGAVSTSGGDTVLIKGGFYREGIAIQNSINGSAAKPTTFGAYGDAEVILDGSQAVTGWSQVMGSVYKAPFNTMMMLSDGNAAGAPVGVVVNDVPLKQVTQGQGGSTAPQVGIAGVTAASGKWGWDSTNNLIYADFGSVSPTSADVVVPNSDGGQYHVYFYNSSFLVFDGLTIRGSGSNGVWGYGHDITVENCNIKFNAKSAVSFQSSAGYNTNNSVLTTHAYFNTLLNWPRGNNGFAESGGGWSGGIAWTNNANGTARGNIVHETGGEGIITYGSGMGMTTGSVLFEQNVAYDNWSVNMYVDNQPHDVARQNFLYDHSIDTSDFLYYSTTLYAYQQLEKYRVCMMLADEQNSSDGVNGYASLNYTEVYDNVFANCRIGIRDYSEGTQATANHGLKNTVIANNTIVMYPQDIPQTTVIGIYLQDNMGNNTNSFIENTVIYAFQADSPVVWSEQMSGPLSGITLDYNDYFGPAAKMFNYGLNTVTTVDLAGWQAAFAGSDKHSTFADPLLMGVVTASSTNGFFAASPLPYSPSGATPGAQSPTIGSGTAQQDFTTNFEGAAISKWNMGAY